MVTDFYTQVMKLCQEANPMMPTEDKLILLGRGTPAIAKILWLWQPTVPLLN